MKTSMYIRSFIRHHGEVRTIVVGSLVVALLVVMLASTADLILSRTLHPETIYLSALITSLVGPGILYLFVSLISQLDRSEEKLRALSIMDDLTDVYNRRYFIEQAEKERAKAKRYGTVFSIIDLDVDHIKHINETYGHGAGDLVLKSLANTCMNNLRTMDVFARLGSDEFTFLIPESDKTNVDIFAKKVLDAIEDSVVVFDDQEIRFTVSMGVKTFEETTGSLDAMLKDSNDALYEAKNMGRNCVVVCDAEDISFIGEAMA